MSNATPAQRESLRRGDVVRIVGAATTAALAIGFTLADPDSETLGQLSRLGLAVALIALLLLSIDIRLSRRLERLEKLVEREAYWRAYSDAFADLSGETTSERRRQ